MLEKDKNVSKILMMAGIFRLDEGRWPQSASELAAFVERKGWSLDFSPYHTLTFRTDAWRSLIVEVSRLSEGDLVTRERIDVEPYFFERAGNQSMPLRIQTQALPPQKAEVRNYCSLTA
jgi:hypothetical protein